MRNFSKYKKTRAAPSLPRGQAAKTGWEQVSDWYGGHMSESDSLLNTVVNPGVLKLLAPEKGKQYLGHCLRRRRFHAACLLKAAFMPFGFDASPSLIERAAAPGANEREIRRGRCNAFRETLPWFEI
jgi:hypothetical protein